MTPPTLPQDELQSGQPRHGDVVQLQEDEQCDAQKLEHFQRAVDQLLQNRDAPATDRR